MLKIDGLEHLTLAKPQEQAVWDARARILWGDTPEKVAPMLAEAGLSSNQIDLITIVLRSERAQIVRQVGMRNTIVGGAMLGGAILAMIAIGLIADDTVVKGMAKVFAMLMVVAGIGLFILIKGALRLMQGADHRGPAETASDE